MWLSWCIYTVENTETEAAPNNRKCMIIKNYAPFTGSISEIKRHWRSNANV